MSLKTIQRSAEDKAIELIESVRRDIVLTVLASNIESPHSTAAGEVARIVSEAFDYPVQGFRYDFEQAWDEGVKQGGKTSSAQTTIGRQLQRFEDITASAFKALGQGVASDIRALLTRAGMRTLDKAEVLAKIGMGQAQGLFAGYQARAVGIVEYEIYQIEGFAHQLRAAEAERVAKPETTKAKGSKKMSSDLVYVFMTEWQHNPSPQPRVNHIAMDGKAVVRGKRFQLIARDGTLLRPIGPHAAVLPMGEKRNCHCTTNEVAYKVSPVAKDAIEAESDRTGGISKAVLKEMVKLK